MYTIINSLIPIRTIEYILGTVLTLLHLLLTDLLIGIGTLYIIIDILYLLPIHMIILGILNLLSCLFHK